MTSQNWASATRSECGWHGQAGVWLVRGARTGTDKQTTLVRATRNGGVFFVVSVFLLVLLSGCGKSPPAAVRIGQTTWQVELATDDDTRHQGLSGRKDIPSGTGMLFVFPNERTQQFYMRDCYVPLDLAYISAAGRVVDIHHMAVEPDPADPKVLYTSRLPALYALEVPAGDLKKADVKLYDRVELLGAAAGVAKEAR